MLAATALALALFGLLLPGCSSDDLHDQKLTFHVDEQSVEALHLYCYPRFAGREHVIEDQETIQSVLKLVNGRTFSGTQTLESLQPENPLDVVVGGYSITVSFVDAIDTGEKTFTYDPSFPGNGVAMIEDDLIYVMDDDPDELLATLEDLVAGLENGIRIEVSDDAPPPVDPAEVGILVVGEGAVDYMAHLEDCGYRDLMTGYGLGHANTVRVRDEDHVGNAVVIARELGVRYVYLGTEDINWDESKAIFVELASDAPPAP